MLKDRSEILLKNKKIEVQKNEIEESKIDLEKIIIELKERNKFIETLLQELSHRVKNNLQLVISLLDMQVVDDESSAQNSNVQDTKNRLTALILVHQRLYGKQTGTAIFMPDYIKELGESIDFLNKKDSSEKIITYDIEPIELMVEKVISLGLIINEIITNSFKHAFKNTENPQIIVSFNFTKQYNLKISDNGSGFIKSKEKNRTGMSLINSLTKQLEGTLNVNSEIGKGSTFTLNFE
jgi:two-component sensor histidine kinase